MDSNDTRTTIRSLMRNLASDIRDMGSAEGLPWPTGVKAPIVYMDGISDEWEPAPEEQDAPLVVVSGTNDTHEEWGGDFGWTIEVLVAMDCSSRDLNKIPSQDDGSGIRITGEGAMFEATVNAISNVIRHSRPGAILKQMDRMWSFHTTPVQFAVLTLTYTSPQAFEDVDDDYPVDFQ